MADLKVAVELALKGDLGPGLKRAERDLERFSAAGSRHLARLHTTLSALGRGMEGLGNRWAGMLSAAAVAAAARQVMDLEHRITMLSLNAQTTPAQAQAQKERIFAVSRQPDIRLRPDTLLGATEKVISDTGDQGFVDANLRNMGLLARATDASGVDVGGVFSFLQQARIRDAKQINTVLDIWSAQGKTGAFTLGQMARYLPVVGGAYAMSGRTGPGAMREMGAALQSTMQSTHEPGLAATSLEAMIKTFTDPAKIHGTKKSPGFEDWGIKIWEPRAGKDDPYIMRPITDLMKDVVRATAGNPEKLGEIFKEVEAKRGLGALATEYQQTGRFDSIDSFMAVGGDGTQIGADAARAARDSSAALDVLTTAALDAADAVLNKPTREAANFVTGQSPDAVRKEIIGGAVGGLGIMAGGGLALAGAPALGGIVGVAGVGSLLYASLQALGQSDAIMQQMSEGRRYHLPGEAAPERLGELHRAFEGGAAGGASLGQQLDAFAAHLQSGLDSIRPPDGAAGAAADAAAATQTQAAADQTQAAAAQAQAAQTQAQAAAAIRGAAASLAGGINGTITVRVIGPAQVTGVTASGPLDITASDTGQVMVQP